MNMRCVQVLTLILIFSTNCLLLEAQYSNVKYRDIGNLEDYSFIQTTCIFQDSRGLIWIGTEGGLDRWDGSRIVSYPYTPFDSLGLQAIRVHSIAEDDQNNLWITAWEGGLFKFDLENDKLLQIDLPLDTTRWGLGYLKYDRSGFLWLGCTQGLFRYFPQQDSLCRIPVDPPGGEEYAYFFESIEYDTAGVMWVAERWQSLYYFDRELEILKPQLFNDPELPYEKVPCTDMSLDPDGNFWMLGDSSDLLKFNPYTRSCEVIWPGTKPSPITDGGIQVDSQGKVWFGMANGLMVHDPVTGVTTPLESSDIPYKIRDIFEDSHGNILVATLLGAKIVDRRASEIRTISAFRDYLSKAGYGINEVVRDDQTYWLGTYSGGIIKYNSETDQIDYYREGEGPGNLSSDYIKKIIKDRNDRIWVMAGSGDLHRYDPQNDRFEHFPFSLSHFIAEDENGFFWICDIDRMLRIDPLTLNTTIYRYNQPLTNFGSRLDLRPFIKGPKGFFWLGGTGGLYRIDPISGNWTHFTHDRENPSTLANNDIRSIICDSENRIWIGTAVGLSRIITYPGSDSISIRNYLVEDGIPFRTNRITEDNSGNIWIGTYTGIYVIKPNGNFESYTYKDGLPDIPMNIWALNSDPNGSIYAGAIDFVIIPPDFLEPNECIPPLLLTEFRVSGEIVKPGEGSPVEKSILFADRIDLMHDQNFIRIDFAALNYIDPNRNQYRYLLQGIDKDTIHSRGKTYAEYTDLAPGKYAFWVTGSNNTGLWNPEGTSIIIRIHPPWYKSYAVLATYFLLVLALIYSFIRYRTARLRKEKIMLENEVENRTTEIRQKNKQIIEMEQLKTRFFTNISHEFRTLITLIKGPVEDVLQDSKTSRRNRVSLEVVRRNAHRLMKLVNQLLDISKIDTGSMNLILVNANVYDYAHAIAVSFSSLAESKGIQYRFHLPAIDRSEWFDADKLEKVINNLLSNAFKFTEEGGKVVMEMKQKTGHNGQKNILEITVSDTGHGIAIGDQEKIFDRFYQAEAHLKKEGGGTGIGLALTHDLINLMHGQISLQSEPGKGSTFSVQIPLGRNHLQETEYTISEIRKVIGKDKSGKEEFHGITSKEKEMKVQEQMDPADNPMILVVEDNADIRMMIVDHLESEYKVIEAVDGSTGLKLAIDNMPELVITDLMMPRMDGIEMCTLLKSDLRTSHIPVIMLTAKATLDDRLEGLETGADDYIPKPFEIKEVQVRIRNLIEQRRKLREKFSKEITINPQDILITSVDQNFLQKAMDIVEKHMSDEKFDVSMLSKEMNMSRSTLFRKLEAVTNLSPVEFTRSIRLKRAASLLKQQFGNVSEVALEVGFSNPSYFSRIFRKSYEVSPSEYAKSQL